MKNLTLTCCECRNVFYAKTDRALYCSKACKQKAYRIRSVESVKAKMGANAITLTMDEWSVFNHIGSVNERLYRVLDEMLASGESQSVKAFLSFAYNHVMVDKLMSEGLVSLLWQIGGGDYAFSSSMTYEGG